MNPFTEEFDNQYSLDLTPDLKVCFRLRDAVYRGEMGVLKDQPNEQGVESDEYDHVSVHCLVRQKPFLTPIGTTRITLPPVNPLPLEKHLQHAINPCLFKVSKRERVYLGEVGRFLIKKDARRLTPHPIFGILKGFFTLTYRHQIFYCYAAMEPVLYKLLLRKNIVCEPIGMPAEYHGIRQPFICQPPSMVAYLHRKNPQLWSFMTDNGVIWPLKTTIARRRIHESH